MVDIPPGQVCRSSGGTPGLGVHLYTHMIEISQLVDLDKHTGPCITFSGLVSLFNCWHCVDVTIEKLRAICDLSGAVAHFFLFGTPISSWRTCNSSRRGCWEVSSEPLLGLNDASGMKMFDTAWVNKASRNLPWSFWNSNGGHRYSKHHLTNKYIKYHLQIWNNEVLLFSLHAPKLSANHPR